jgi:serine/threonine protein kinase
MTNDTREKKICELLMKNPHKNIIKIYRVAKDFIDMELLNMNINAQDMSKIKNIMMEVKTYLQSLGIMYIDWKLDNIGISEDGEIKLFDFDGSGLIDIETKEWIIEPPEWWSYNQAIQNGMVTPSDIDNYTFDIEFENSKYN